jgi:hypothetical protein
MSPLAMCNGTRVTIGILGGTGPAGRALGTRLAANGYEVILGSRGAERGEEIASEVRDAWPTHALTISGGANETAAAADQVVLATPWEGAVATAVELAAALAGKVVISMVNALARFGSEFQALVPVRGSMAATLQAALPQARIVAAFQHLPARELGDLESELVADVLICADDRAAGLECETVVNAMTGLRAVQAGSLAQANAVEALTAVLLNINIGYRSHVSFSLGGLRLEGRR